MTQLTPALAGGARVIPDSPNTVIAELQEVVLREMSRTIYDCLSDSDLGVCLVTGAMETCSVVPDADPPLCAECGEKMTRRDDGVIFGFHLAAPAGSNWWVVLGVSPEASAEEIRAAYRALARDLHPDNQATGDADKFITLQNAHDQALTGKEGVHA